jgi:hypothetical protein
MFKLAIDISLASSGYTIADIENNIIKVSTIKTNPKLETKDRL